jgi:hypothetical protein
MYRNAFNTQYSVKSEVLNMEGKEEENIERFVNRI